MNTPVKFEIAKLLKEKGFDKPTLHFYFEDGEFRENTLKDVTGMDYGSEYTVEYEELLGNWNDKFLTKKNGDRCFGCRKSNGYFETFSAPAIFETVMWIYEKHDIWINVDKTFSKEFFYIIITDNEHTSKESKKLFNSPTEAYEAAILYTLKNLI